MPDLRATYPVPACLRQFLGALALALAFAVHAAPPLRKGVNADVRFDGYSPLAKTQELFFRELGPLAERRALAAYAERKEPVPEYTVDPKGERFAVFVPSAPAPARLSALIPRESVRKMTFRVSQGRMGEATPSALFRRAATGYKGARRPA